MLSVMLGSTVRSSTRVLSQPFAAVNTSVKMPVDV